jgi:transcriptional regulator with XRE-family HTH domain
VSRFKSRAVAIAFGAVVRTARTGAAMSQEDLAFEADLDRTYPSLLARGLREPGLGVVLTLGKALGIDPVLLVRMTAARLHREDT